MTEQRERATRFHALHVPGKPLVLFNAWDPGSAATIAATGAKAIATGSASVAYAHGYQDGEKIPLALVLANLKRIVAAVELPVTLDFEAGYAREPARLAENIAAAVEAGAIGFNFEDGVVDGEGLYPLADQVARIRAIRAAAERAGVPIFLNARTDAYLQAPASTHDAAMVDATLERARAYADAGASGLFVPGLVDEALVARCCADSPLPVNVMLSSKAPSAAKLASLGVARISHGPGPYRLAMKALADAARAAHAAAG